MKDRPGTPVWSDADDPGVAQLPPQHPTGEPPRFKVSELLVGRREAILEHEGQEYRLRITANRKLILTK